MPSIRSDLEKSELTELNVIDGNESENKVEDLEDIQIGLENNIIKTEENY